MSIIDGNSVFVETKPRVPQARLITIDLQAASDLAARSESETGPSTIPKMTPIASTRIDRGQV
jgi:hypothetical protein